MDQNRLYNRDFLVHMLNRVLVYRTADLSLLLACPDLPIVVVSLVRLTILASRASSVDLFITEHHPRPSICALLLPLLPLWPPPSWPKADGHQPILPKSTRHALVLVSNPPCTPSKPPSPSELLSGERELDHSHCCRHHPYRRNHTHWYSQSIGHRCRTCRRPRTVPRSSRQRCWTTCRCAGRCRIHRLQLVVNNTISSGAQQRPIDGGRAHRCTENRMHLRSHGKSRCRRPCVFSINC